jgi:hypothetical protein
MPFTWGNPPPYPLSLTISSKGFNKKPKMKDCDMVVYAAQESAEGINSNNIIVTDRYAVGHAMPLRDDEQAEDGINDTVNVDAEGPLLKSGVWFVTFSRPLVTNDTRFDYQFDDVASADAAGARLYLLAAYRQLDFDFSPSKKHTKANATLVNLLTTHTLRDAEAEIDSLATPASARATTAAASAATAASASASASAAGVHDDDDDEHGGSKGFAPHVTHGTVMMLSWVLLGTASTFVSRYLKPLGEIWFRAHVAIAFAIVVGSITGFSVIVAHIRSDGGAHFDSVHARTGLALLLLMVLQVLLGYVSHTRYNPARTHAPIYPDRLHWYIGRGVLLLSFAAALMGVQVAGGGLGFRQWPSALLVVCIMMACGLFVAADSRYLTGRRRGEEESALAEKLKRWLFIWIVATGIVICVIAALLE